MQWLSLNLTWPATLKTGFLALKPKSSFAIIDKCIKDGFVLSLVKIQEVLCLLFFYYHCQKSGGFFLQFCQISRVLNHFQKAGDFFYHCQMSGVFLSLSNVYSL